MSVYTEAAPMFAPIDDFDDEPMIELPATLSQAWFNDVIDASTVDLLDEIFEQEGDKPLCPSSEKPFIPSALDVLEGRAQVVADTYTFAQDANEVRVINPATESAYSITKLVGEAPVCSCPAFKHSKDANCKHLLALCIKGIDIPETQPARRFDIEPLKAREAAMATPRPYVEIAAADW